MRILNVVPNPPTYFSRHVAIVNAKRDLAVKASLSAISVQVDTRYQLFQAELVRRNLQGIAQDAIMLENKGALLSCYKNKTKRALAIFDEIENAQLNGVLSKCPYCGITRPGTFDHYLPESKYPEFAVHAVNLIPCCSDCNSSKGDRLVSGGLRQYLHYYSDVLPDGQFLFVEIITRPNSLAYACRFRLSRPQGFDNDCWQLIENHFSKLKLLSRYKNEANDEIGTCFTAAKSFVKNSQGNVSNFINDICDDEAAKFGESHWRVVLKRQLAQTPNFINYVNAEANRP